DPGEQRDLAASAPERVRALQERLARFALGARAGEKSNAKASASERELLRQLGYAGEDDGGKNDGAGSEK
ncbi:MAG: hypothetical protein HOP15_12915, partial [Planctomycetes bacterium]|nr:hypothetical protein [Planctomycetota bacterium]